MRHNEWPRLAGLASFALLAVGCAAFLLASGDIAKSVMGAGLLLLAAGQIIHMALSLLRQARIGDRQTMQGKALRDLSGQAKAVADRLQDVEARLIELASDAEQRQQPPPPQAANTTLEEMQVLRQQLKALANDIAKPYAEKVPEAPPPPAAARNADRLDLLLEPMIEFSTGETTHYRALLHMMGGEGEIPHDELMRRASANGARARLDVHLLEQSLPVLRRLRQKSPAARIFVPVGAATLTSPGELRQMIDQLGEQRDVATGIVLEIIHTDLAQLSQGGIEGLAQLARLGVAMSLTRVSLTGLDLMSLRQLGVRFLDIDARTIDAGYAVAPAWTDFAQYARSMQYQLVAGHIENSAQSQSAAGLARFGYGPFFAPPRRVKLPAGQSEPAQSFRAA